ILELYLNEIYLGQRGAMGVHGVIEGARFYFGKEPGDLTLGETASLAGLIRAPGRFAPTRDPARALARRKQVLRVLLEEGKIDQTEFDAAVNEPLPERLPSPEPALAPYFVDFVRGELEGRYEQEDLVSQGFRIFTTLDASLQTAAAAAVERGLARLEKDHPEWAKRGAKERLQAALVALEPTSGEIRAMVGGRAYAESQFNRATQARRQVGSIFKPVVALAAFEEDERHGGRRFPPSRRVEDAPFEWRYEGQTWTPANFDNRYFGEATLRMAIEQSLNSATARIAREVGLSRIRDLATRLGFPVVTPVVPSLVLGAIDATPLEVAQAYAAIASLGFRSEALSIRSVLDAERQPLERATLSAEQVVSPRVAHLTTTLLEGVVERGTARAIRAAGIHAPVAGKTGTTNDGRDAWFAGFTPDLVVVVWVGFDQGDAAGLTGSRAALPIWIDFMKEVLADRSTVPFLVPPGIRSVEIDPASGGLAAPRCPARVTESFLGGEEPAGPCPLHADPDPLAAPTPVASPAGVALSG
ncbi:MAG: penicillin-binding transpeptidase domain-containing protein, partial [Candidatus Binatia bacterium]